MMRLFLLITFMVLLSAACRMPAEDLKVQKTIIVASLKGPSSMGLIHFIDSISKVENATVDIKILDEPLQVRKMMLDGTADFALLPTTMAAILYNKGLEYRLMAIPVWGTLYLFGSDTTIKTWEDLKNKRIHVMAKGMTPDILLRYLLVKYGLDPEKDVNLDYSFPTHIDLANAVASGIAELGVISEPLVSLAISKNKKSDIIFDLNTEWYNIEGVPLAQTAIMVKADLLSKRPGLAEEIINAFGRSIRWVNSYPDSAAVLIVKYNILPTEEIAAGAITRSHIELKRAEEVRTEIEEYLRVFYTMSPDIIGGKMPDENFIY